MEKEIGLIGYTGFVGSNILESKDFTKVYNSKNIEEIEGVEFSLLICSGVYANKWWANENPVEDLNNIKELIWRLDKVKADTFVLISTIDVYKNPVDVDERTVIDKDLLSPYGLNRYFLEEYIQERFKNSLIVRLPGLFGTGLRKNFIFDMMNPIPQIIKKDKMLELTSNLNSLDSETLLSSYENIDGYYKLKTNLNKEGKDLLLQILESRNFTSRNFTDSRSIYQFYNLKNLSKDIDRALKNNISLLNLSVQGLEASYIAKEIFNIDFVNIIENNPPALYDFKSIHSEKLSNKKDYIYSKEETLKAIANFVKEEISK